MSLSDFLAILDILVTILIGFVITHMVSVRDSRTRAIKDYYIKELADIKSEINEFYSDFFRGELGAQDIIGWYSAIRNRVDNFDKAVRMTFRIYEASIAKKLFNNYKDITDSRDFNENYKQKKIIFNSTTKVTVAKNQKLLYMLIEQTLYDINNARARDYIERKKSEFKSHYSYYLLTEKKTKRDARFTLLCDWFSAHRSSIFVMLIMIVLTILFFVNIGRFVKQNSRNTDHTTQKELIQRLDNMNTVLREISHKNAAQSIDSCPIHSFRLNEISSIDTSILTVEPKSYKEK